MPLIYTNREYNGYYYTNVMEDPNPDNERIFIGTNAHDLRTLTPSFNKKWHFNWNDLYEFSYDNNYDYAPMYLENGTIQAWGNGDAQHYGVNAFTTFHKSLEWANFPVRNTFRTAAGNIYWTSLGRTVVNSDTAYARAYLTTGDCTTGNAFYRFDWATRVPTHYCYEDTSNSRMYAMCSLRPDIEYVSSWTNPNSGFNNGASVPTNYISNGSGGRCFFMGTDNAGWTWWLYSIDLSYSGYYIYKIHPTTLAVTTVVSNAYPASNTQYQKSWPSNLYRRDANTRVFYRGDFVASQLVVTRYVWDTSGSAISSGTCSITYPGANTYTNYANAFTTEGFDAYARNSWMFKPWTFVGSNGTRYITFWICDKSPNNGSGTTRWNSTLKRTMVTYSVGTGTSDNQLTYHSSYTFTNITDLPRDYIPINATGDKLCVPNATPGIKFWSFNTTTGWQVDSTYNSITPRSIGVDRTYRVWAQTREQAYNTVHAISPTRALDFRVVMASSSYAYAGSNIATTATVNAYTTNNTRAVSTATLQIVGTNAIFTSTGTTSQSVTTSSSADTTVNITITGPGIVQIRVVAT